MAIAESVSARHYFPALDGVRIAAALWVLLFHITGFFPTARPIGLHEFAQVGFYGVDIFFCLSGFLLAAHYGNALSFGASHRVFLRQRLLRLYPLHLAVLLALAVMVQMPMVASRIAHGDNYSLINFLQQMLLVSAWKLPIALSWNHPAWAVSAEWLLYLLAPLYFLLLRPAAKWPIAFAALFVLLTPLCVFYFGYDEQIAYGLPRALCGFGCGLLVWRWRQRLPQAPLVFLLLAIAVIALEYFLFGRPLFFVIPFFALLIAAFSYMEKVPGCLHVGARYSYALYLTQYPVLLVLQKLQIQNAFVFWLLLIAALSCSTLAGYHVIEKQFLRKKHT